MFGVTVTIPSTTLVIELEESAISTSYIYLPAERFDVALAVSDRVMTPLFPPVATVKLTEFDDV